MAKVVILSGAGISAESGINTFRESGGLWEEYSIQEVCQVGCLESNRTKTLEFYDKRRMELQDKEPNIAHKILAKLKKKFPNDIVIITQNVDNLFEKAGLNHNIDVIHLHGFLPNVECEDCGYTYEIGYNKLDNSNNICPKCSSKKIRPHIVMFGEMAPMYQKLEEELYDCELFVVIGTSGNVIGVNTIANFVDKSILNNLEPSDAIEEELFDIVLYQKASIAIDTIASEIENFLN